MPLSHRRRRAVGVFRRRADLYRLCALRAACQHSAVPALDASAQPTLVHVERLAAVPEVLGDNTNPLGLAELA